MMTSQDIYELNQVTNILAGGLAFDPKMIMDMPLEIRQALVEAREQMENLPEVIENLNLSFDRFNTISTTIAQMIKLADQACAQDLAEDDRAELNEEFSGLAKILAADAGRTHYAGPRLNLLNCAQAQSASKIVRYLNPVITNMEGEMLEQRDLICEVISETINFLGIVTQCYPAANGVASLNELIAEVRHHSQLIQTLSTPAAVLH